MDFCDNDEEDAIVERFTVVLPVKSIVMISIIHVDMLIIIIIIIIIIYMNHDVNSPRLEVSSEENDDEEDPSALVVVKSMTILDYITSTCW